MLLVVASSYDPKKFCTLLDHVLRCDGSRTTSLRHQDDGKACSPSNPMIVAGGFYGIHGLRDPCDLPGQLC
jgi:hypothetical protein